MVTPIMTCRHVRSSPATHRPHAEPPGRNLRAARPQHLHDDETSLAGGRGARIGCISTGTVRVQIQHLRRRLVPWLKGLAPPGLEPQGERSQQLGLAVELPFVACTGELFAFAMRPIERVLNDTPSAVVCLARMLKQPALGAELFDGLVLDGLRLAQFVDETSGALRLGRAVSHVNNPGGPGKCDQDREDCYHVEAKQAVLRISCCPCECGADDSGSGCGEWESKVRVPLTCAVHVVFPPRELARLRLVSPLVGVDSFGLLQGTHQTAEKFHVARIRDSEGCRDVFDALECWRGRFGSGECFLAYYA